jgi:tellurite resistance protein TehA-like permease
VICFANFKKHYKITGVGILVIAIVSIIHHSNERVGFSAGVWSILDVALANIGNLIAVSIVVFLLLKKKTHVTLAVITILLGVLSTTFLIFSEIEGSKVKVEDPTKSWGGKIFTVTDDPTTNIIDYTEQSRQAMFLVYHTIWHILSGLTVMIWAVSVMTNSAKQNK